MAKVVAKKKEIAAKVPDPAELAAELGPAVSVWKAIVDAVRARVPCEIDWRPANPAKALAFGRFAVLQHKGRRLVYLLPRPGCVDVRIMLGERAFALASAKRLSARIKKAAAAGRVYAEGHDIHIAAEAADVAGIMALLDCKMAPK